MEDADKLDINKIDLAGYTKEYVDEMKFKKLLSDALKDYTTNKSLEEFEKDWDCKIMKVATGHISGIVFNSDKAKTAFYLKYDK